MVKRQDLRDLLLSWSNQRAKEGLLGLFIPRRKVMDVFGEEGVAPIATQSHPRGVGSGRGCRQQEPYQAEDLAELIAFQLVGSHLEECSHQLGAQDVGQD